jgi:hypothetical protein
MSAKSYKNAKKPRVVPTLEMKLKSITDSEAGKQSINIRREHGIPPTTARTITVDKQKYKDVAKLAVPDTTKCIRT